jgi:four helix bundle protein
MAAYKNLEAWKHSMQLVKEIYTLTKTFPKEEMYALSSQLKRAAVSVPSNIAEGCGRNYKKDTIQFLHIARGSLYETETQVEIARMNNFIQEGDSVLLTTIITTCMKTLNGLITYYENADLK